MKDIKELIYAAVEENALKFQELVNNQLQVRAYDAIEALRPEVGASMFGESSHKKMDDEEDMEDMEDEDEDEDEDEKKSKVEEELKGKQHKIDKNKNGKIDAHDFKLLRKEEAQQIAELSKKTVGSYLKKATNDYADRHGEEGQSQGWDDARGDSAWDDSPNEDDREEHEKEREANIKKMGDRNRGINRAIKKLTKEEIEALDEIGDTPAGRAALGKLASQRFGRARWAAGVHRANSRSDSTAASPHSRLQDKDSEVGKKAADKAGIAHRDVPDHNYDFDKKGGVGTKVADPAHKLAARNKPKMEEVEQVNELSTDKLTNYAKAAKASRASLNKKWDQGKASWRDKEKVMNREKGENRAHKIVDRRALVDKEMNEVAMPQNQADWQALITHQIKTTGHPVATDAQFRATHGKDETKIASLEPGKDKLHYAAAQGGTVKR